MSIYLLNLQQTHRSDSDFQQKSDENKDTIAVAALNKGQIFAIVFPAVLLFKYKQSLFQIIQTTGSNIDVAT